MQKRDWWWKKKLFTKCEKLADIQNKYDINDPNEVFNEGLSKEKMVKISKFIEQTEIENKNITQPFNA